MIQFSYLHAFQNHWTLAAFSLLTLTFVSMYVFKNNYIRLGFFLCALFVGFLAGHVSYLGVGLILGFAALFYLAHNLNNVIVRQLLYVLVLLGAIGVMLREVPGIYNWHVLNRAYITDDAIPYTMRFTFDKALIGLFFIWFSSYSLANGGQWKSVLKIGILCGLAAMVVLLPLSFLLGYVKYDLKLIPLFFLWAINNLIFVSIAEEAVFRGMIQQSLTLLWQKYKIGKWLALVIAAVLFGLAHYKGGVKYICLASVAGLFYGYAYMKAKKIEASVITHFMVNATHFVFFTYPALQSAFN